MREQKEWEKWMTAKNIWVFTLQNGVVSNIGLEWFRTGGTAFIHGVI